MPNAAPSLPPGEACRLDAPSVARALGSDLEAGLARDEAVRRLEAHGRNALPEPEPPSRLKQLLAQFANPIVLTLLAAAVIAMISGASQHEQASWLARYGDAVAILLIVVLNAVLGYYQELKAEAALDALKKMQSATARVVRGGEVDLIAADALVAGDVIEIEAGDSVPADARLVRATNLSVEEASLTGESVPVEKSADAAVEDPASLADRANMVFVGTSVVRGKARAIVTATGGRTELGAVSAMLTSTTAAKTPLEEKLDQFGSRILKACLAISAFMFAWGLAMRATPWHELLLEAVSLAVAAIPEGLPAITTITLALGMTRMAARGAIVRRLSAVETLGAATVVCTDKTGTLTRNEMTVRELVAGGARFRVSGSGYGREGSISADGRDDPVAIEGALAALLESAALATTAELKADEGGRARVLGDPTEGALLAVAAKGARDKAELLRGVQLVREFPFESERKRMSMLFASDAGGTTLHVKGSADVLAALCTEIMRADGTVAPITEDDRAAILRETERLSSEQLRVLAVARRTGVPREDDDPERELTFLGLAAMIDPPRDEAREAVRQCALARIRAVMITGDHKLTAIAIAKELGLWSEDAIALTGSELDALDDGALAARIENVRVFARVSAEQKLRIVRAFRAQGEVVAMTGDGVNDAPALREAHIGIAMGRDGTDVARAAADMVLADDNFATIVDAIREGRAIYRNIQKFIYFLLSSNAGLIVTVFVASLVPHVLPLKPLMILWINLVTNGLPALALGVDPPDPGQMKEPPRKPDAGLLSGRAWLNIAVVGVVMGALAMGCYLVPWTVPEETRPGYARAMAFSLLALSPLFHALSCRSPTASIVSTRPLVSRPLVAGVAASAAIHLTAVVVPSLREVFQTYAMSTVDWLVLLGASAMIVPAVEMVKALQRSGVVGRDLGPMSRRA